MALFTDITPSAPGPRPEMTLAQKQTYLRNRARYDGIALRKQLVNAFNSQMKRFWADADNLGLTPQEAFDAVGTDGAELLTMAGKLKAFILDVNPAAELYVASKELTLDETGKIVVAE